jgi:hypothetical protein
MGQNSEEKGDVGRKIAQEVASSFAKRPPRDPARIEQVLTELKKAWYSNPDLRFHQLLSAVQPAPSGQDNFYQEDDVILADLRKFNAANKS